MSPVAMPDTFIPSFTPLFEGLRSAPTAPGHSSSPCIFLVALITITDAKAAADRLAREVAKNGFQSLE